MKVGDRRVFLPLSSAFTGQAVTIVECLGKFTEWSAESYRVRLDQPIRGHDQWGNPWKATGFIAFEFELAADSEVSIGISNAKQRKAQSVPEPTNL